MTNSCLIPSCCSVTKLCLALCDPMDCSTPGLPVTHRLLELAQVHAVHQWCQPTISSSAVLFSFWLQSIPASGTFSRSQLIASGGKSVAAPFPLPSDKWFVQGYKCMKSVAVLSAFLSKLVFICLPWMRASPWFFFFFWSWKGDLLLCLYWKYLLKVRGRLSQAPDRLLKEFRHEIFL